MLQKHTGMQPASDSLEDIYNYLPVSEVLGTSGQPTEKQFTLIRDAGYETVINLAPTNVVENSVKHEDELWADLGMTYVHIPVAFDNPREQEYEKFVAAMQAAAGKKVWVHCAANARVSAFVFRYRCGILGENNQAARQDLEKIWQPVGVWKKFIRRDSP